MFWYLRSRLRDYFSTSLWILPILMAVAGFLLAQVAVEYDRHHPELRFGYSSSQATTLLAAMFSGLLTFIGFLVTMLLLVPQFAGAQLTPRVLAIWYRQYAIKLVMGFFFASATYVFYVLGTIRGDAPLGASVLLAGALVLFSFAFFLWFMNRFVSGIRPATMATTIAHRCRTVIVHTYPHPYLEDRPNVDPREVLGARTPISIVPNQGIGGYLLSINVHALVRIAGRVDGVMVFPHMVGDYVIEGEPLVEIYADRPPNQRWLSSMIAVGAERTPEQDPAYMVRILVDMANTALSAAINAPTTAKEVLDRIEELLHLIAHRDLGDGAIRDDDGTIRVIMPRWTWTTYLRLATREIGAYGAANPQIDRRLRAMLDRLADAAPAARRPAIEAELQLLRRRVERTFTDDPEERHTALTHDAQGLGYARDEDE